MMVGNSKEKHKQLGEKKKEYNKNNLENIPRLSQLRNQFKIWSVNVGFP